MDIAPQIITGRVFHKRHFPKVNQFTYRAYYLALPLAQLPEKQLSINRPAFISFYEKDYGAKDGTNLTHWIKSVLGEYGLHDKTKHIMLISMPRILGYIFNPVNFWLCLDDNKQLRAVLCEVNNTFGETHSYLCAHPQGRIIDSTDWLQTEKLFHVSPFLQRDGHYQFRFALEKEKLAIWVNYFDAAGRKQLSTALTGALQPLTRARLQRVFWTHPLLTLKTIMLIHWQAVRLFLKGIRYIRKPEQRKKTISTSDKLTKT